MYKRSKRVLLVGMLTTAFAARAYAEVTIGGSMEANIFYEGSVKQDAKKNFLLDIEPHVAVSGKHPIDLLPETRLIWKVETGADNYILDSNPGTDMNSADYIRTFGNRQAWVGAEGEFGSVRLGKMFSPSYDLLDSYYATQGGSMHIRDFGSIGVNPKNSIRYDSPNFNGFQVSALYSLRTQTNYKNRDYFYDIALGYAGQEGTPLGGAMFHVGYSAGKPRNSATVKLKNFPGVIPRPITPPLPSPPPYSVDMDNPIRWGRNSHFDRSMFVAGGYRFGDTGFTAQAGYKYWNCKATAKRLLEGGTDLVIPSGLISNYSQSIADAPGGGCNFVDPQRPKQGALWVRGIYAFGDSSISLTYAHYHKAKDDVDNEKVTKSEANMVLGRYSYNLMKNAVVYLDGRYVVNREEAMVGATPATTGGVDNKADNTYRIGMGVNFAF